MSMYAPWQMNAGIAALLLAGPGHCALPLNIVQPDEKIGATANETFVVELRFNRSAGQDFADLQRDRQGRLYVPVQAIFELGEGLVVRNGARWRFDLLPARRWMVLDLARGRLLAEKEDRALLAGEWLMSDGNLLLHEDILKAHFDLSFEFDPYSQRLSVTSSQPWPADLRRARTQQWGRHNSSADDAAGPQPFELRLPYQAWGTPQADVSLAYDLRSGQASYAAQMALEALWLTQRVSVSGSTQKGISSLRWQAGRTDPSGGVFGVDALYDWQMGDVQTLRLPLVGTLRGGRGMRWQATPLDRPTHFDSTSIEGDAPAGWDAELYAGGLLVDFSRVPADGRYRFENVPLTFGANRLRVVLHGPQGQREERVTQQSIGAGILQPGAWQSQGHVVQEGTSVWSPAAQRADATTLPSQRATPLSAALMIDHGVSGNLTVGARWSRNLDGAGVLRDYVGLAARPVWSSNDFSLDVMRQTGRTSIDGTHSGTRATQPWASQIQWGRPVGEASMFVSHEAFGPGFRSPRNGAGSWRSLSRWRVFSPLHLPFERTMPAPESAPEHPNQAEREAPMHVGVSLERGLSYSDSSQSQLGLQLRHGGGGYSWGHEWTRQWTSPAPGAARLDYRLLISGAPWGYELRGALNYALAPERKWNSLTLAVPFSSGGSDDLTGPAQEQRWHLALNAAPARQSTIGLGWSQNQSQAFLSAQMAYGRSNGWSISVGLNFSWADGGSSEMMLSPQSHASQGMADVWVSAPRYGTPESADEPAVGTRVLVDNMSRLELAATNALGHARVPGLSDRSSHLVALDPDSLPDPFLVPRHPVVRIWPRPGQSIPVAMQLLSTVQVSGQLQLAGDDNGPERGLRGIVLQAIDEHGRVHAETRSFNDGAFQFENLYAGEWRIRLRLDQRVNGNALELEGAAVSVAQGATEVGNINLRARMVPPAQSGIEQPAPGLAAASRTADAKR